MGNLAPPIYGTPGLNTQGNWNPQAKYAEGIWHPPMHPLGNSASRYGTTKRMPANQSEAFLNL